MSNETKYEYSANGPYDNLLMKAAHEHGGISAVRDLEAHLLNLQMVSADLEQISRDNIASMVRQVEALKKVEEENALAAGYKKQSEAKNGESAALVATLRADPRIDQKLLQEIIESAYVSQRCEYDEAKLKHGVVMSRAKYGPDGQTAYCLRTPGQVAANEG